MVKRFIIILLLMTKTAYAECKYYAEADVVNDVLVNKKEHYTCKEKKNFFVQFLTEPEFERALTLVVMTLLENL